MKKTISELGETGIINTIAKVIPSSVHNDINDLVGIGDDCAVIPIEHKKSLLISTDVLVENIHFLRNDISPKDLGYKSIAVNLSDIAAMGGIPKYIFLSLSLPGNLDVSWLDKFLAGQKELIDEHQLLLLGGNTSGAKRDIVINLTIIGEARPSEIKYRSSAKPGDVIFVTDYLGDSLAGLHGIKRKLPRSFLVKKLINRHYRPTPNIAEGRFLAIFKDVHAMIDISDGLNIDLGHICAQSDCGANINLELIPKSLELLQIAKKLKLPPYMLAVTGGEDYCLLGTIAKRNFNKIADEYYKKFKRKLFKIGTITTHDKVIEYFLDEKKLDLQLSSFDHFK